MPARPRRLIVLRRPSPKPVRSQTRPSWPPSLWQRGAAHVAVARQARCRGRRRTAACRAARWRRASRSPTAASVASSGTSARRCCSSGRRSKTPTRAVHEVVDVQRPAVGRQRQALRRAAGVEAEQLAPAVGVDHRDLAAGLQRDEQVDAARVEDARRWPGWRCRGRCGRRRSSAPVARSMRELIARTVFWKFSAEAVAQRAALDVVLLGRHPGLRAVGRDRRRAQVVGDAAALVLGVGLVAVRAARWCAARLIVAASTASTSPPAGAGRADARRALAGQRRRDEARDEAARAVGG